MLTCDRSNFYPCSHCRRPSGSDPGLGMHRLTAAGQGGVAAGTRGEQTSTPFPPGFGLSQDRGVVSGTRAQPQAQPQLSAAGLSREAAAAEANHKAAQRRIASAAAAREESRQSQQRAKQQPRQRPTNSAELTPTGCFQRDFRRSKWHQDYQQWAGSNSKAQYDKLLQGGYPLGAQASAQLPPQGPLPPYQQVFQAAARPPKQPGKYYFFTPQQLEYTLQMYQQVGCTQGYLIGRERGWQKRRRFGEGLAMRAVRARTESAPAEEQEQ